MQVFCTLEYQQALLTRSTPPDCRGHFANQPLRQASLRAFIAASLHRCIAASLRVPISTSVGSSGTCAGPVDLATLPMPCHQSYTQRDVGCVDDYSQHAKSSSWRCIEAASVACGSARCSPRMRYPCLQPGFVPCVCRPHLGAWAIFDRLPAPWSTVVLHPCA